VSFRFYVQTEDGWRRLPHAAVNGNHRYPQLAGQRCKAIQAHYEIADDSVRFSLNGHFDNFDSEGAYYVPSDTAGDAMQAAVGHAEAKHERKKAIPNIAVIKEGEAASAAYNRAHRWDIPDEDKAAIQADLTGHKRIPILKAAKRSSDIKAGQR
jgi:hypothetical protein